MARDCDTAPVVDWSSGAPRNLRYGDVYHSSSGALAQARHVFMAGCGLPSAWADAGSWNVLETGFGLGLNFLAVREAARLDPRAPARLRFVSVEAHPVDAEDVRRAGELNGAALAASAKELADRWPSRPRRDVDLVFDDGRVHLQVLVGDAADRLRQLTDEGFEAHSIFLDGFSPDRNPAMWSRQTLAAVAHCARPGSRLATWSVAREVRTVLADLGYTLQRRAGLPPKWHRLQGIYLPRPT
jgi:tRNA 5-methylaminomethyl-2-thiouridine biosynthesis bifunctional protein